MHNRNLYWRLFSNLFLPTLPPLNCIWGLCPQSLAFYLGLNHGSVFKQPLFEILTDKESLSIIRSYTRDMDSRKILSAILVVAIVAAVGYLGYIIINPKPGADFTEFYILNREGKARNYPGQVVSGESVDIIIGVVNHEYKPTSYRVDITGYGIDNKEIRIDELAHGKKFEEMVSFVPQLVGEKQEVEFWLYKNGELEPYFPDPLGLSIDVIEP